MRYRHRVTVEAPTEERSETGVPTNTWSPLRENIPATITVSTTQETRASEYTTEAARYDIVLAGRHNDIDSTMAVVDAEGNRYDIEFVDRSINLRQTRLVARLVVIPVVAVGS